MTAYYNFFFIALPYMAIATFFVGSIYRYTVSPFKFSSLSSQFLEGKTLFWGSVPFHFGILVVFMGHLLAFAFPKSVLAWNAHPVRLIILEVTAFIFGLSLLLGLFSLFVRRLKTPRIRVVTSYMDIVIEVLLLAQVVLGCWVALGYRWGSSWFAADLSPYLWSIIKLNPQIEAVKALPHVIQAHIIGAFIILLLIPFSRLVHFLVVPLHYIFRPYQQVMWYWDRKTINDPSTSWNKTQPKNN